MMRPFTAPDEVDLAVLAEHQAQVEATLVNENMLHGTVADAPVWSRGAEASIWRVYEGDARLWLWALAGDALPCDYLFGDEAHDARSALRGFAARWFEIAAALAEGRPPAIDVVGFPIEWEGIAAAPVRARAERLRAWADDDAPWRKPG